MRTLIQTFTFVASFFFITSTSASLIVDYDLINDDMPIFENSLSFMESGLTMDVSGWTTGFNGDGEQLEPWQKVPDPFGIFYADLGLGLVSNFDDGPFLDGGASADYPYDPDEGFLLVFSQKVELLSLWFEDASSSDDINVSNVSFSGAGVLDLLDTSADNKIPDNDRIDVTQLAGNFVGSAFMVWLDGDNDDVALAGVRVAVVPEPSGLMIMFSGLLLLAGAARKR
ncbi:hypothetical protein OE749_16835 [Aestuariibacter sp. AA17]|uniref:PEP-CTERM protein-sorting domain-containing protein n=1 Tax=Fluctibacter corallii TaxID=2984329 RepID=A0ABT3ACJ8_9ALTE|nr:hypothetical protein [Aestuariibacter sp. AA17]MCV2886363.1 hypothetical protein [Aestuariibacter sp. AA17]